jgi:phosphodiesterase/alkaline phosphatase D-like protein
MNCIKKDQLYLLLIFLIIIAVIIVTFINYPIIYGNENSNPNLTVNEGIASGDVTHESAIIWSRVNKPSIMHVEYANNSYF